MGSSPRRPGERKTPREDGCVKPVVTGRGQAKEEGSMSEVRKSRDEAAPGKRHCLSRVGSGSRNSVCL